MKEDTAQTEQLLPVLHLQGQRSKFYSLVRTYNWVKAVGSAQQVKRVRPLHLQLLLQSDLQVQRVVVEMDLLPSRAVSLGPSV